jgi:serine/threonine-protein phosphatase 6 regulatory ankyrin repeat subunit B
MDIALIKAAENGEVDRVRALLESGANPNLVTKDGCTALMLASRWGHRDCVELLLSHRDNFGASADPRFRCDVNVADEDGWTALMWASRQGHRDCVELLLSAPNNFGASADPRFRCDVNVADEYGWTALMHASFKGHRDCVELLLSHRDNSADPNLANNNGKTALMYASRDGHRDCVQLLEARLRKLANIERRMRYLRWASALRAQVPPDCVSPTRARVEAIAKHNHE